MTADSLPPGGCLVRHPVWGWHEPVAQDGQHLGAVVQVGTEWRPVCSHDDCQRRLTARGSSQEARADLRLHWTQEHTRRPAA